MGDQRLTLEELSTLLCQVESCLNSRPLLPLYSHPDDGIDVLTPGHLLVGRHLQSLPDHNLIDEKQPLLRHWSLCQSMVQHFWRRWSHEYLQQLQQISKWKTPSRNVQPNDVVVIKEVTLVTTHWTLGRIHPHLPRL